MTKDPQVFIEHIWESIKLIELYVNDQTVENFFESKQLQDAVVHRLEIMGEAVKNIPLEFTNNYPEIPWKELARTRDKLSHGYFGIDLTLIWEITQREIPDLKNKISRLRSE